MSTNQADEREATSAGAFVNPESLAAAGWLAARIDDPGVRVIDARYIVEMDDRGRFYEVPGRESFLEAHIPGAAFLDLDHLQHAAHPAHIVDGDTFEDVMSRLGIGNDDEVVVYDIDGGVWAARIWWALRLYGHGAVKILDGGFTNWVREELPVDSGEYPIEPARFVAGPPSELRVEIEDVVSAMSDPDTVIVDGLTEPFHSGNERLFPRLRAGHIPGAVNVPAPENLDPETDRLLPVADVAELWRPVVENGERVITYCGRGMYGAFDMFVLHLLGYAAALYDGSWEEWAATEGLPISTSSTVSQNEDR